MSVPTVKNKKTKLYGLTGGIATGKSTVANYFKEKKIKVFDSDLIVKEIWRNNNMLNNYVKEKYSINMKTAFGKKQLSNIIFKDNEKRKEISELIHPIVFRKLDEFIKLNQQEKFIIIDMPLLFEVNYNDKVDKILLVYTSLDIQIERLMLRDKISKEEAILKINSQYSLEEKRKKSDYIIDNNNDFKDLKLKLERLYEEIVNEI